MKNKNNILLGISFLLILLGTSSCESFLDENPPSLISDAQFWQNNTDANIGVAAIYDGMQKTYNDKFYYWGELRSDNYVSGNTPSGFVVDLIRNTLTSRDETSLSWDEFYTMVSRANLAIEKIPKISGYDQNLLGEAYAIRAFAYFDAYRVWGGVPIFTEVVTKLDANSYRAKNTKEEVLALVLSDLAKAESLVNVQSNRFRFSKASVLALKAKIYMHMGGDANYAIARTALDGILVGMKTTYTLATTRATWYAMFPQTSETGTELIFSIRNTQVEDGNNAARVNALFMPGVANFYVAPSIIAKWKAKFPITQAEWEAKYGTTILPPPAPVVVAGAPLLYGDYRLFESVDWNNAIRLISQNGQSMIKYHRVATNSLNDETDVIVYRLSDIVLLRAEVENKIGSSLLAIDYVNQIRTARQLPKVNSGIIKDVDVTDKNAVENLILDERQMELLGEGQRWWDLLRTKKAVEVMGPINGQTEPYLIWPIFVDHILRNPTKLEQTLPYN